MKLTLKLFLHVFSHWIRGHRLYPSCISNQSGGLPLLNHAVAMYCGSCNLTMYLRIDCPECDMGFNTDSKFISHVFHKHGLGVLKKNA